MALALARVNYYHSASTAGPPHEPALWCRESIDLWTVTLGVERRGLRRPVGGRLDVIADGVPRDRERLRFVEGIGKRRDSYCYVVPAPAGLRSDPQAVSAGLSRAASCSSNRLREAR